MSKAILIFFIILVLEISTFACSWNDLENSFNNELNAKYPGFNCQTMDFNNTKKVAHLNCANKKSITVNFENNKVSFLSSTQSKYPYLSQCWVDGFFNSQCKVSLNDQKCQVWDLRIVE